MDWNLKAPSSWDLSELEQETFSNLGTVNGSSSFGDQHRVTKGDFSVDLNLGQLGGSGNNQLVDMLKQHGGPKAYRHRHRHQSSLFGASKRSRAAYNGSQTVSCLVDGCRSDLSTCRDYQVTIDAIRSVNSILRLRWSQLMARSNNSASNAADC